MSKVAVGWREGVFRSRTERHQYYLGVAGVRGIVQKREGKMLQTSASRWPGLPATQEEA